MSAAKAGSDKVTLKIPRPLYNRLRQLVADSGFNSVTEFAVFVLRDVVSPPERPPQLEDGLTSAEVDAVRRRLRKLGYL
ncbi:MAG: hypothetical protein AMK73_09185 [Planctomycetes bacterium SM23_32]|nr:MAG: hypothetical protein AMK73_09185 [Planctomycetes bacterium SM23_32]